MGFSFPLRACARIIRFLWVKGPGESFRAPQMPISMPILLFLFLGNAEARTQGPKHTKQAFFLSSILGLHLSASRVTLNKLLPTTLSLSVFCVRVMCNAYL